MQSFIYLVFLFSAFFIVAANVDVASTGHQNSMPQLVYQVLARNEQRTQSLTRTRVKRGPFGALLGATCGALVGGFLGYRYGPPGGLMQGAVMGSRMGAGIGSVLPWRHKRSVDQQCDLLAQAFMNTDSNSDGKIDFYELHVFGNSTGDASLNSFREAFRALDLNSNEFLEPTEINSCLSGHIHPKSLRRHRRDCCNCGGGYNPAPYYGPATFGYPG